MSACLLLGNKNILVFTAAAHFLQTTDNYTEDFFPAVKNMYLLFILHHVDTQTAESEYTISNTT